MPKAIKTHKLYTAQCLHIFNPHCVNTVSCLISLRLLSFIILLQIFWPPLPVPDLSGNWGFSTTAVWKWETKGRPLRQVSNNFITEKFGICALISRCWVITPTVSCPSVSQQQKIYLKEFMMEHNLGLITYYIFWIFQWPSVFSCL